MIKKISILFLVLFSFAFSQSGRLKGNITDGNLPIPGVNIILVNTSLGAVSDRLGNFVIDFVPYGEYVAKFSSVGYETKTTPIKLSPNHQNNLKIILKPKILETKEVQVTGFSRQQQRDTRTSVLDLDPRSAKILPGAGEDVLRTLQSLPGVLAPNDFSSQLIVRGSGPDQNLIIMDDVEIFNPYRLYGVISMFNPEAVSNIDLVSGGFPAKYGDRLSAVLDVTNREGTSKKYLAGKVNASIIDANVVLEGKAPFNLNGSWLINSRRTYYDLIIEPFVKKAGLVDENVSFPNFYDLQGKLVIGPYNGHKFLFNGILSRDGVDVISAKNRKTADSIGVDNTTRNDVASFAWHWAPNTMYLNKLILSWYRNGGNTNFESEVLDPSLDRNNFKDIIPDTLAPYLLGFKFSNDFTFRKYALDDKFTYIWGDNIFEAGAGVDFMETTIDFKFQIDPQLKAFFSSNPQFRAVFSDLKDITRNNKYHGYIQNNFKIGKNIFFQPGFRFDYYDVLRKNYLAPRISLSWAVDDITTLRAVWGNYYQSPGYEKLLDRGVLYDLSKKNTNSLNAEKSSHYVLGVERWLDSEWNIRLEGYYKDFTNLIIPKKLLGSQYITHSIPGGNIRYPSGWTLPNTILGDSLTQIPINNSYGNSYGLEILLAKKNVKENSRFSGWISYSYAFANRTEEGDNLPFRFDQRHTVNFVVNYKFNNWLDFGIRWQYGSGFPITEPVGIKPRIILADLNFDGRPETPVIATRGSYNNPDAPREVIFDIDYGDNKLNSRKPAYHRMDIRLTFTTNFWSLDWNFYLDVINVYNRKNVVGYNYFVDPDLKLGKEANNMFPIIPTLGLSVKF